MICDIMKVKAIAEKGSRSWAVVLVWRTCLQDLAHKIQGTRGDGPLVWIWIYV